MRVLLLVPDAARRRALALACAEWLPGVHLVEASDAVSATFAADPSELDLVVVDSALLRRDGGAWVAHWRRAAPRSALLLLAGQASEAQDLARLRQALPLRG